MCSKDKRFFLLLKSSRGASSLPFLLFMAGIIGFASQQMVSQTVGLKKSEMRGHISDEFHLISDRIFMAFHSPSVCSVNLIGKKVTKGQESGFRLNVGTMRLADPNDPTQVGDDFKFEINFGEGKKTTFTAGSATFTVVQKISQGGLYATLEIPVEIDRYKESREPKKKLLRFPAYILTDSSGEISGCYLSKLADLAYTAQDQYCGKNLDTPLPANKVILFDPKKRGCTEVLKSKFIADRARFISSDGFSTYSQ